MVAFALIGAAGYIAPRHMRAIRDCGGHLAVACDVSDSVGVIDGLAPDAAFFTEFERFEDQCYRLRRPRGEGLDFLSVCTPNHLHHAHVAAGLRLGCDVICEKPLVPTTALLDDLVQLEEDSGARVSTILQLRLHPAIRALRSLVGQARPGAMHEVELTYITSRGAWYDTSWKADPRRSGGLAMNIGIHFFDMLHYLFGERQRSVLHLAENHRAAGLLHFERALVRWFLSTDAADLPRQRAPGQTTFRSITLDGRDVEFSDGFADLHSRSYAEVLAGRGFGLAEVRPSIETVEAIRNAQPLAPESGEAHPWLRTEAREAVPA